MSSGQKPLPQESLLISADELAVAIREASASPATGPLPLVLVDCRFNLLQPDAGCAAYQAGHLPGARYADLDRDLSGSRGPGTGRHPLPDPDQLRALFGRFGITGRTRVVAYDEGGGSLAARLWWLLRWMGHRSAAVLDGGLAAWRKAGQPLTEVMPEPRHDVFTGQPGQMPIMDTAGVAAGLAANAIQLLDVRAEERFLGQVEPLDPVAGHVPGAVNVPFSGNLDAGNRFRSADELASRYARVVSGYQPRNVVCMCGSGVTACHAIFALELAGISGVALYPGSWSEWIRSPDRPVATE